MTSSDEKTRDHTAEEYSRTHKGAFRAAFDFLNTHFPPGAGDEWWVQTVKDILQILSGLKGDRKLAEELLMGVYGYLENELNRRMSNGKTDG